ncbi:hypothetical protein WOLCODRAFT_158662 [Wolfiporia cocos MD-104 SS10]|uniref:Uncharacterized protein n=1 Tax=Wolfiporia cocos (strain MD-104) TaxID=742152 RepID=A0A2H3JH06_WOLCO|nr:hypothetical protein WOLCODRAFT_158662 [Wolfiporia cocos MD-104 SS10]
MPDPVDHMHLRVAAGQHQDWRATPAWVVGSSQQATPGVEKAVGRESYNALETQRKTFVEGDES